MIMLDFFSKNDDDEDDDDGYITAFRAKSSPHTLSGD